MKNYKQCVVIGVLGFILSCTSNKKIQQDDEFATDSAGETVTADAGAAPAETSEFDLNETPASPPLSDTAAAAGKDEFADFEDPTAQVAPVPTVDAGSPPPSEAQPKDEFADFEQPATPTETPPASEKLAENKPGSELNSVPAPPEAAPIPVEIPPAITTEEPPAVHVPEVVAETPKPVEPVEEPAQISAVNYQSNQSGGAVSITASRPIKFTTRLNSATNQLVIELPNATIPARLKRSLNTKDMASSIGSVDIYQKANSNVARFVVQLRPGSVEPLVQPEGNSLLVIGAANEAYVAKQKEEAEAKAVAQAPAQIEGFTDLSADGVMSSQSMEQFLVGNQKYYGKKISIETNNLEIKEAIKFIAEESGTNLLMDEGLEGKISLKLRQVPWDQALILILKAKKLGYVRQGNVLRIAKLSDLQTEEVEAYKLLESRRSNEPLIVKRFFISYAKLSELEQKIREFITATASTNTVGAGQAAGASPVVTLPGAAAGSGAAPSGAGGVFKGRVIADERTGSLIVTDTPDNLIKIEKLIAALDTQPKQIVVESRIISASESFTRSLGVFWSSTGSSSTPNSAKLGINNLQAGVFDSTFTWGNLDIVGNLDARIALGEIQNKVRVLKTQRTTVISGQTAKIESKGQLNIPTIQTNTSSNTPIGTSGFTIIDFGLTGEIVPQASNENTISASINLSQIEVDDPKTGSRTTDAIGGRVVARNGQTVVVQANFNSRNTTNESGVPGLKDIPVLGLLFKGKADAVKKAETMLFATMYILDPVGGAVKKAAADNSELEIK